LFAGFEALTHANTAAEKAAQSSNKTEAGPSVKDAFKMIKQAVDIMDEVQRTFDRNFDAGRCLNATLVEAVDAQASAIKRKRLEVEGVLRKAGLIEMAQVNGWKTGKPRPRDRAHDHSTG
jgi:hypothetical protein